MVGSVTVCSLSPKSSTEFDEFICSTDGVVNERHGFVSEPQVEQSAVDTTDTSGRRDHVFDRLVSKPLTTDGIPLTIQAPKSVLHGANQIHGLDETQINVAGQILTVRVDNSGQASIKGPEGLQPVAADDTDAHVAKRSYVFAPEGRAEPVHVELSFAASSKDGARLEVRAWSGGEADEPHQLVGATLRQLAMADGRVFRQGDLAYDSAASGSSVTAGYSQDAP